MNPPRTTLKVGHIVFLKKEISKEYPSSTFSGEPLHITSQCSKIEDGMPVCDAVSSRRQLANDSSLSYINLVTRIKTEEGQGDSNALNQLQNNIEIKTEISSQSVECERSNVEHPFEVDIRKKLESEVNSCNPSNHSPMNVALKRQNIIHQSCNQVMKINSEPYSIIESARHQRSRRVSFREDSDFKSVSIEKDSKPSIYCHSFASSAVKSQLNQQMLTHAANQPCRYDNFSALVTQRIERRKPQICTLISEQPLSCTVPVIRHAVFLKEDFSALDSSSTFESEPADPTSKSMKSEGGIPLRKEVKATEHPECDSSNRPSGLLIRLKNEKEEDADSVDPLSTSLDIKEEPEQWSDYENVCENSDGIHSTKVYIRDSANHYVPPPTYVGKNLTYESARDAGLNEALGYVVHDALSTQQKYELKKLRARERQRKYRANQKQIKSELLAERNRIILSAEERKEIKKHLGRERTRRYRVRLQKRLEREDHEIMIEDELYELPQEERKKALLRIRNRIRQRRFRERLRNKSSSGECAEGVSHERVHEVRIISLEELKEEEKKLRNREKQRRFRDRQRLKKMKNAVTNNAVKHPSLLSKEEKKRLQNRQNQQRYRERQRAKVMENPVEGTRTLRSRSPS